MHHNRGFKLSLVTGIFSRKQHSISLLGGGSVDGCPCTGWGNSGFFFSVGPFIRCSLNVSCSQTQQALCLPYLCLQMHTSHLYGTWRSLCFYRARSELLRPLNADQTILPCSGFWLSPREGMLHKNYIKKLFEHFNNIKVTSIKLWSTDATKCFLCGFKYSYVLPWKSFWHPFDSHLFVITCCSITVTDFVGFWEHLFACRHYPHNSFHLKYMQLYIRKSLII